MGGLLGGEADDEVLVGEAGVAPEGIVEGNEVEGGDVVGVLLVDFVGELPAFVFLAEAKEVGGEGGLCGEIGWVEGERLALSGGSLCEAVLPGELEADEVIDAGVGGPMLEGPAAGLGLGGGVVAEVSQDGTEGPCVGVGGIDLGDGVEVALGLGIVLGVDLVIDEEEEAGDVAFVDAEGVLEGLDQGGAVAVEVGACEAVVEVGVVGLAPDAFLEGHGGEGGVVLVEGDVAAGEVQFREGGVGLAEGLEYFLDDDLGIRAEDDGGLGEGDARTGVAEVGGLGVDEEADVVEEGCCGEGVAGGECGMVAEPTDGEAAAREGCGVGEEVAGGGVLAGGEEGLGVEDCPVFGPAALLDGLHGGLDDVGVFSEAKGGAGVVKGRGGLGAGEQEGGEREEECERGKQARGKAWDAALGAWGWGGAGDGALDVHGSRRRVWRGLGWRGRWGHDVGGMRLLGGIDHGRGREVSFPCGMEGGDADAVEVGLEVRGDGEEFRGLGHGREGGLGIAGLGHLLEVGGVIGANVEASAWGEGEGGEVGEAGVDEATFPVAALGPWVREIDVDGVEGSAGDHPFEDVGGFEADGADVGEAMAAGLSVDLAESAEEAFDADEVDEGVGGGVAKEERAVACTELELDGTGVFEQGGEVDALKDVRPRDEGGGERCGDGWDGGNLGHGMGLVADEEGEGGGVAVEVGGGADGTDLAVGEESGEGDGPEVFLDEGGVVVRLAEQALAAAAAGEEEGADGLALAEGGACTFEATDQVGVGGVGVTSLELEGLAWASEGADGEGALARVHAEEVADEEVAGRVVRAVLRGGEADHEVVLGALAFLGGQGVEGIDEDGIGGAVGDAEDDVAFGTGDGPGMADGGAALGDHGKDGDGAGEGGEDDAMVVDVAVEVELAGVRPAETGSEAADDGDIWKVLVPCGEPAIVVSLEGVGEGDGTATRLGQP